MRARDSIGPTQTGVPVRDRILGDTRGPRDEALIFAASSIIREITSARYDGTLVEREVQTDLGSYTLQGSRAFGPDAGQPVVLIFAKAQAAAATPAAATSAAAASAAPALAAPVPAAPALVDARARFRLTRKEAEVAELLIAQYSNEDIAAALCISSHTARHHTQNVLSKLGVRSRREVADVLGRGHS